MHIKTNNKIHAIWLGERMTPLSFACIDDWQKQNYEIKVWTEKDPIIKELIDHCKFAKEAYNRKLYAFVTDYLRLKLLQIYGGLYLDTDVTINKNPFPLFEEVDFSVGYENKKTLGSAIIYARKESLVLKKLVLFYEQDILHSKAFLGPNILTMLVDKYSNMETVKCYSSEYFYGYQGEPLFFEKTDNSYLIHWFQHSWKETPGIVFLKSKHGNFLTFLYEYQKYWVKKITKSIRSF